MKNRQSSETVNLASRSEIETINAGKSLASSIYKNDTVIWLSGELGAGKTTFVKGLGLGLGLGDVITSPTYALENRFDDKLLHMDLYRLDPAEAKRVVEESEEFLGVRVVEWSERLSSTELSSTELRRASGEVEASGEAASRRPRWADARGKHINISFHETSKTDRQITITFSDIPLPSRTQIEEWHTEVRLPEHIALHCDAVGDFARKCGEELLKRGIITRPLTLQCAGEAHDLLRFVDICDVARDSCPAQNCIPTAEIKKLWGALKKQFPSHHEAACANFLEEKGYPEFASIIRSHGLRTLDTENAPKTTEQKILFYADKRVMSNKIVTLDERFDDFIERYGNGTESEDAKRRRKKTEALEQELFGDFIPQ